MVLKKKAVVECVMSLGPISCGRCRLLFLLRARSRIPTPQRRRMLSHTVTAQKNELRFWHPIGTRSELSSQIVIYQYALHQPYRKSGT